MPVIDTRKRKPTEPSALDQLADISMQQLESVSYSLPTAAMSDMSDSDSDHSGDALLRRWRRPPPPPRHAAADSLCALQFAAPDADIEDAANEEGEATRGMDLPIRRHKRHRVDEHYTGANFTSDPDLEVDLHDLEDDVERMRTNLRRAERALVKKRRAVATNQAYDQWCSQDVHDEILRLQATLEKLLARTALRSGCSSANTNANGQSTPLQSLRMIHAAVQSLQTMLMDRTRTQALVAHTRPELERLWQQALQHADQELHTKLSFWMRKALDLKTALEASTASTSTSDPTTKTAHELLLKAALDFVSTFHLLAQPADPVDPSVSAVQDGTGKDVPITRACELLTEQLHGREMERLRDLQIHIAPESASTLTPASELSLLPSSSFRTQRPPAMRLVGRGPERSPLSSTTSRTNIMDGGEESDESSEEDEPLPSQSAPTVRKTPTGSASSSALRMTPGTASRATPPAKSPLKPTVLGEMEGIPQASVRSLNPTARDRLQDFINGQLQSKAPTFTGVQSLQSAAHAQVGVSKKHSSQNASKNGSSIAAKKANPSKKLRLLPAKDKPLPLIHVPSTNSRAVLPESEPSPPSSGSGCSVCGRTDSPESILLCDNDCGREYHALCLDPPVIDIPEDDWYCPKCLEAEGIEPGVVDMYKCSVDGCGKITASRYCGQHRCQAPQCMNIVNAVGFCRKHRQAQRGRSSSSEPVSAATLAPPPTKKTSTPTTTKTTAAPKTALATGSIPASTAKATAAATTATTVNAAVKPRISFEEAASRMVGMGIYLPPHVIASMSKNNTPTAANSGTEASKPVANKKPASKPQRG